MAVLLAPAFGQQPPQAQNQQGPRGLGGRNTPTFAGPPPGMQALPNDLFTSKNFYKDRTLDPKNSNHESLHPEHLRRKPIKPIRARVNDIRPYNS